MDQKLAQYKVHYQENNEFLRAAIYWMVRREIADELVQEAFVKGWKSFGKFKKEASFRTWIYRIAMNTTYDYLRKHGKQIEVEYEELAVEKKQEGLKDLISKALMKLNLKQREVFILYYKLEYTSKEISDLLDISEGTVKSRLHHAREIFKDFLKENGVDHE